MYSFSVEIIRNISIKELILLRRISCRDEGKKENNIAEARFPRAKADILRYSASENGTWIPRGKPRGVIR